jgi:hypothetical protein
LCVVDSIRPSAATGANLGWGMEDILEILGHLLRRDPGAAQLLPGYLYDDLSWSHIRNLVKSGST